jgi:hypothetical protein
MRNLVSSFLQCAIFVCVADNIAKLKGPFGIVVFTFQGTLACTFAESIISSGYCRTEVCYGHHPLVSCCNLPLGQRGRHHEDLSCSDATLPVFGTRDALFIRLIAPRFLPSFADTLSQVKMAQYLEFLDNHASILYIKVSYIDRHSLYLVTQY